MASIPGRPFNVGFTFRIIAAPPSLSLTYNVTVYSYNTTTAALEPTTELADGARLARGSYIEHTVGRGNDKFTVVHISCSTFCEVRIIISIYMFMAICWLCAKLNSISISLSGILGSKTVESCGTFQLDNFTSFFTRLTQCQVVSSYKYRFSSTSIASSGDLFWRKLQLENLVDARGSRMTHEVVGKAGAVSRYWCHCSEPSELRRASRRPMAVVL